MWSLGSEWDLNLYFGAVSDIDDAVVLTNASAALVKSLDTDHPVVSSYSDPDQVHLGRRLEDTAERVAELTNIDVWSLNVYRGSNFWLSLH